MSEKPFYKGKKFVYAMAGFIAALVLAVLPAVFDLPPETVDSLQQMLLPVLVITFMLIAGHSVQDAISASNGLQNPTLNQAVVDLINAVLGETLPDTPDEAPDPK